MPGLSDHERKALKAIERDLTSHDRRLARRLAHLGRLTRWRWRRGCGRGRSQGHGWEWFYSVPILIVFTLIALLIALLR